MNKELLLQIFKAAYNRQSFIDNVLLPSVQGKVDDLEIYDEHGAQEVELTPSEEQYAKSAIKYGEFTTRDEIGRTVELYEVILHDHKQVERSRVGIAALIKKQIIGNNAVLVNFAYENPQNRSWRFSFVAHDAVFTDGEMVQSETNPKRYTYVFGEPDETYRTALDRFYTLGHEYAITVETLKDAFGVEAMSKAFFDEYRDIHYNGFVDYLTRSNFKQSAFNGSDKAIRDFVKKLLGRIVFLYFIQKKGWLGASNSEYKDGDKNFMSNFYRMAGANEGFYSTWLSKLFFETLNTPRPNDAFEMPDGSSVKVPYLNGGLFEKESKKYDYLTFPADLFSELFDFFDQYNFTIYEDSPEEHTVAVDPEMLGHIFENLLEDNKDKGAFYTPKEIVHYMTQESLIEYLHTQLPAAERDELEAFVKNKDNQLSDAHKKQMDQKLDAVKICDPAIGSGAFPMGLLQEIFGMKERIAYDLGYTVWSPATVKEHIIQNSIYGVDIEQGAVDIARLRFWLSLIVDEDMPKPLPNLEYKIVVGNSLVSKFGEDIIEIDWSTDSTTGGIFGQEIIEEKTKLLKTISAKQKEFFTADNDAKSKLSAEIRQLKLDILAKQLELMIETKGAKQDSNSFKKPSKKQHEKHLETEGWKRTLFRINHLKSNDKPINHFEWRLDFPEILNPLICNEVGFDIIIANPPYLGQRGNKEVFQEILNTELGRLYHQRRMDLFYFFIHFSISITKKYGVLNFITTNYYLTATYSDKLRQHIKEELTALSFIDFNELRIFESASGQHNLISTFKKGLNPNHNCKIIRVTKSGSAKQEDFVGIFSRNSTFAKYFKKPNNSLFESHTNYIRISDVSLTSVRGQLISTLNRIKENKQSVLLGEYFKVEQGIVSGADKVTDNHIKKFPQFGFIKGKGIYVLSNEEVVSLKMTMEDRDQYIKKTYKNSDIKKWGFNPPMNLNVIYIKSEGNSAKYPKQITDYLDQFKIILVNRNVRKGVITLEDYENFINGKIEISYIMNASSMKLNNYYCLSYPRRAKATFEQLKIVNSRRAKKNIFALESNKQYEQSDIVVTTLKENLNNPFSIYYLLAILNSKLYYHWFYHFGKRKGELLELFQKPITEVPLLPPSAETRNLIETISRYCVWLCKNSHQLNGKTESILSEFESILDALVFELYFPDEFQFKGIAIEKHAKELFVPIGDLDEAQKVEQINAVYEELRKKENPLRNQIKLMKIELKDLLLPILSV